MDTMRDVRMRLKSILNTKQITESMRLISTRKVQKVRVRMADNRPYLQQSVRIIQNLHKEERFRKHGYFAGRGGGKPLVILITGDRGLCGGYNTNAAKEAYALAASLGEAEAIAIGAKGRDYFRRRQVPVGGLFRGLSENPFHEDARRIAGIALDKYNGGEAGEVYLVYTEYHTMLAQEAKAVRLLPVDMGAAGKWAGPPAVAEGGEGPAAESDAAALMDWASEDEAFVQYAVSAYVAAALFGAMLESAVCEQCARVMSMDSAVKNAEKMIETLTLRFNEMRQGAITQEIAEVVGGANVVGQK